MRNKLLMIGIGLVAFLVVSPLPGAFAITLEVNPAVSFQQTTNNPCVIGDPSCKQPANFDYTKDSGAPANQTQTYDLFSPAAGYLAANQVGVSGGSGSTTLGSGGAGVIPITFKIGIDDNFAQGAGDEFLVFFKTYRFVGGVYVLDAANSYIPASPQELFVHNGNGFSDALLFTFNLIAGDVYKFEASVSNDTDGMEEFFIIPENAVPVPEPNTLLLLGGGLVGLAVYGRKAFKR